MGPVQPPGEVAKLETENRMLRFKYEQVKKDLETINATKTMRILKPARDTYGRLRSRLR
jgi:hypothetical protein